MKNLWCQNFDRNENNAHDPWPGALFNYEVLWSGFRFIHMCYINSNCPVSSKKDTKKTTCEVKLPGFSLVSEFILIDIPS